MQEKCIKDVFQKVWKDEIAKGLRVGQGASGVAGESYLKRVAEVMRDSLLNEKEAYIQ